MSAQTDVVMHLNQNELISVWVIADATTTGSTYNVMSNASFSFVRLSN